MESLIQEKRPRLGKCEVCGDNPAKYTCPECEVKTCCLSCVKIHKKELQCSGVRNRVKYKPLHQFTDLDLQSDYMLLEETNRVSETFFQQNNKLFRERSSRPQIKLKEAAARRGVKLEYLPQKFSRHKNNTTYLNWATNCLYWKTEWVFPNSNNLHIIDDRVLDTDNIAKTIEKYIDPEICDNKFKEDLNIYHHRDLSDVKLLLKAEKFEGNKFFFINIDSTFREELSGKVIIEYPTFYVVFLEQIENYQILIPDDGDAPRNYFFSEGTES